MTTTCEHCANHAPKGQRFCSIRCQVCEVIDPPLRFNGQRLIAEECSMACLPNVFYDAEIDLVSKINFQMTRPDIIATLGEPDGIANGSRKYPAPPFFRYGEIDICFEPWKTGKVVSVSRAGKPDIQSADLMASVEKMITELIEGQVQMDPIMADVINEHIDELLMYEEST